MDSKAARSWFFGAYLGVCAEKPAEARRRKALILVKGLILDSLNLSNIDWVIGGGESRRSPTPMKKEWVLEIKNQCKVLGSAFFFKQWGGTNITKAGRLLNGRTYHGFRICIQSEELPAQMYYQVPLGSGCKQNILMHRHLGHPQPVRLSNPSREL